MSLKLKHDRIKVFISYQNRSPSKEEARILANQLTNSGFTVFFDVDSLKVADRWHDVLYRNVMESDVLIVLLDVETAESDWVQREVDVARGANIEIVPLNITEDGSYIQGSLERLALEGVHYGMYCSQQELIQRSKREKFPLNYESISNDELPKATIEEIEETFKRKYDNLISHLIKLAYETRNKQNTWQKTLAERRRRQPIQPANPSRLIFKIDDFQTELHIACGDIMELRNVDVIVNSENDYMQMARRVDNNTLSSVLRYYGSKFRSNQNLLMGDTVQDELNAKIRDERPITLGFVTDTTGGDPTSYLVRNLNLKYIIHAVTVRVVNDNDEFKFVGSSPNEIHHVTKRCLEHFDQLNKNHQEKPLRNIFLPIFNSGKLGSPISEILPCMIRGIRAFLEDNPNTLLSKIHILAYNYSELIAIEDTLIDQEGIEPRQ